MVLIQSIDLLGSGKAKSMLLACSLSVQDGLLIWRPGRTRGAGGGQCEEEGVQSYLESCSLHDIQCWYDTNSSVLFGGSTAQNDDFYSGGLFACRLMFDVFRTVVLIERKARGFCIGRKSGCVSDAECCVGMDFSHCGVLIVF